MEYDVVVVGAGFSGIYAVHAFLQGRLPFLAIAEVIERTLEALPSGQIHSFDSLAAADGDARREAGAFVEALA